ncbi:phage antirepressor N-terminal domain-containing protein [Vreelandella nanhaiensis]|uniref:Antirepressor protein ant N-terminal domain-containing protein n=1 Tax=Vreelandella nanhaiensis TaxID=1258546 RepID=A0A433KXL6_9GAMM|nr:phage antirepressor N-terminal domain-containing protein [Halomonas nanhaiensis]RUR34472.1 hypothetical protein ELY38_02460 [Halomonas nanhaiensis]
MTALTASPISINFHGTTIPTFNVKGVVRVAMKPICDGIGLQWEAQHKRIKRHPVLSKGVSIMDMPSKGGIQKFLTLPLNKLNGWLFGVDATRVKPEIREKLVEYQEECFDVLSDYWQKGAAENPRFTSIEDRKPLNRAVRTLANLRSAQGESADYAGMWKLINGYLGVAHIEDASPEQVDRAMVFVQDSIERESARIIEGEWLGRVTSTPMSHSQQVKLKSQIHRAHMSHHLREPSAVRAVNNRLKVHFHLREVSDLPAEQFDEAMSMLEEQYQATQAFNTALRELCDAFIKEVLNGGEPWTPWIKRQLGGGVLGSRPDWRRLARQIGRTEKMSGRLID